VKLSFERFAAWSAIVALAFGPAIAQSTPGSRTQQPKSAANSADQPLTTVSVQVKVVNVLATVRDKHGKIANGLTKDDFTLSEDGRPQTIKYFARETDLPLTLGLLVDTSLSQRRVLGEERSASESFLAQILREDQDKAFVIHFDREVELLQDLTASHEKLHSALESLETPQFTPPWRRHAPV
jgi:VWFA-related protein